MGNSKMVNNISDWCGRNNISVRTERTLRIGLNRHWPLGVAKISRLAEGYKGNNYYNYLRLAAFREIIISNLGEKGRAEIARALRNEKKSLPVEHKDPGLVTIAVTVPAKCAKDILNLAEIANKEMDK